MMSVESNVLYTYNMYTQKVLINRAGNKALNLDPWEGFESVRKMNNNLTDLPQNYDQSNVSKFLCAGNLLLA